MQEVLNIEPLIRAGCHLVLANRNKIPVRSGWLLKSAGSATARTHAYGGGLVGIIPGRSDLIVLDIDERDEDGLKNLITDHPPLGVVKTPRGGLHLFYGRSAPPVIRKPEVECIRHERRYTWR